MRYRAMVLRRGVLLATLCWGFGPLSWAQTFSNQAASVLSNLNVNSRSASLADIDNDGDLDVLIQGALGAQRLLRNNLVGLGTLTFTNITSSFHTTNTGSTWSAAWGDIDGDGDVDVFIGSTNSSGRTGTLMRNDGTEFTDQSVSLGLNDPGFHQNVAWCDIDGDTDLDLLLAMEGPEKHEIYLQAANGSFSAVGAAVGFQVPEGIKAYGFALGDTDGDGDIDAYISTCRGDNFIRNNFFENRLVESGSLAFVDIADTNGTQNFANSYNAEFQDFDDDGDLDLFMVGADGEASRIFRNDGGNQFTPVDQLTGHALLSYTGGDLNGGKALDYDNDGDLDLFFHDHRILNSQDVARLLYRNDGNWSFNNVTAIEGLSEVNQGSYDSPWGDIDLDGDLDLLATTDGGAAERMYISNASTNGNHWLQVRLSGRTANTTAIGAALYATIHQGTAQQRTLRRDANPNAGTFNQSDLPVHFGLGSASVVDRLRIVWPDGTVTTYCDLPVDQYLSFDIDGTSPYACPTEIPGDMDYDGDVDVSDISATQVCVSGAGVAQQHPDCWPGRVDNDPDVDASDSNLVFNCLLGPMVAGDPNCAN